MAGNLTGRKGLIFSGAGYLSAISVPGEEKKIFKAAHKGKSVVQMMRCVGLITHRLKPLLLTNSTAERAECEIFFLLTDKWLNPPTLAQQKKKKKKISLKSPQNCITLSLDLLGYKS